MYIYIYVAVYLSINLLQRIGLCDWLAKRVQKSVGQEVGMGLLSSGWNPQAWSAALIHRRQPFLPGETSASLQAFLPTGLVIPSLPPWCSLSKTNSLTSRQLFRGFDDICAILNAETRVRIWLGKWDPANLIHTKPSQWWLFLEQR